MKLKLKLVLFFFSFCFLLNNKCFAGLKLTDISSDKEKYDIVLNGEIKISKIYFKGGQLVLPHYQNGNKIYKHFSVLKRDFKNYLAKSIFQKQVVQQSGKTPFKINKMLLSRKSGNIKAFASVIFADELEVNVRVMESKSSIWIAYPSNKSNGVWQDTFSILNPSLKEAIEEHLMKLYRYEKSKKSNN
ncbi:MAG: SpoVG family protein [Elusimicrobiota bacterium]|jgi:DNA-binding cell septation regulator SpoVG|nr:SpoVG family protein [Elusimicrobiota bacterium]